MNKNDIKILYALYKNQCTNEMKSFTIKKIQEETGLSNTKIRYTIRGLSMSGYLGEGFQSGNASTYYITLKGIGLLKEVSS
ncbi:MAG: hypothetical protein PWP27_609 [Clostridiales bacterium]|jgi:predicted transcriptional regulator|nr:hypothetical protein [Clostridiales bacterium]